MTQQIMNELSASTRCATNRKRRIRTRPSSSASASASASVVAFTGCCTKNDTATLAARISTLAVLCTILSQSCIESLAPSPKLSQHRSYSTPTLSTATGSLPRYRYPQKSPCFRTKRRPSTSLSAAASAWLFTPDRTAGVLADTASKAVVSTANAATDAAMEVAVHAVDIASTVTTDTVVRTVYKAPFISLAISFILGGLFFSTVAAFVASTIALGKENTRRLREVIAILYRRNITVLKLSMQLTMDVLRGKEKLSGFKNRFPAALQTFKDGFVEVLRVLSESVDAIKKETKMYSAAVGLPGLIPIQYIFDRIFPSTLTAPFESALQDALLNTAKENNQIRKLTLKKFSMGEIAPRVLEARLFDLGARDMAFDLEMIWESNAKAELEMRVSSFGAKIPVTISNLRFEGPVRLILCGLTPEEPGWTALLISLPRPPQIAFDIKVAGGLITQIPWLRNEIAKMLDNSVAEEVLWPRRAVVSAPTPFKAKPLLNPMQMLSLMRDDPLLRMERELMASIPDDFRSTHEPSKQEEIPDIEIQVNNETKNNAEEDSNGGGPGGQAAPRQRRLRFWQRNEQTVTLEASTMDTLQLMAQTLRSEASNVGKAMPVMVLEGADEKKGFGRRILSNLLLPKSLLSYASREGGM